MLFFKRRKKRVEKPEPIEIKIEHDRIDNFILGRYGLKDIENKAFFLLLNIVFFFSGVISLVVFMYGKVNLLNLIGTPVAVLSGWKIYHMVKEHKVKHPADESLRGKKSKNRERNPVVQNKENKIKTRKEEEKQK